ncbi:MAG: EFR1 family ferrodoxin [Lachnospiraceae bacterium]|nr:EFR1 family ferrodoxin [Lachnospiraceae bacterium]MBQ7777149.1 EFR1 family ferrodoxin [Lachnospiraceae bacterium]
MLGIYFSGTGNSRYCVEVFLKKCDVNARAYSIEDGAVVDAIKEQEEMVIGYPVQYSNLPKILRDFIVGHQDIWKGKRIFVIATMGLFSGDGAGILARLLQKYGAEIIGGLHVKMPDSIGDEKVLKRSLAENKKLVKVAENKIERAVQEIKNGKPPQEGLVFLCRMAGLFGQRLYFGHKAKHYTDKVKIDAEKCIGCGKCERLCPLKNITLKDKTAVSGAQCTMCYRCVNHCPKQAITLLGKQVVEQSVIEKYL